MDTTEVAIGMTDGFRYVAVRPPLSDDELRLVTDSLSDVQQKSAEQIDSGPACTMLRGGWNTERAQEAATLIVQTLRSSRGVQVRLNLEPVQLLGYMSSPFNPVTD